uniref:Uncharacterized protein n=1 Tax=Oryza punctata TaxID=4537 RepID=A0A0E0LGP6_ORYPU
MRTARRRAVLVETLPVDSFGGKNDGKSGSAAEDVAVVDDELPGGVTASEAVGADDDSTGVTSNEEEVAGSDDDAYSATDLDNYLEYEDDIADGLVSLKIDGDATPPILLDDSPPPTDNSPPPIDAAAVEEKEPAYLPPTDASAVEEEPAYATEYEQLCFDGQFGYLSGGGYSYSYGGGGRAYYGDPYQYHYPATYLPSYYLPRRITWAPNRTATATSTVD